MRTEDFLDRTPSFALRLLAVLAALALPSSTHADEPVVWTNLVNVSASGNTITKTEGPSNAFNAGAASTKGIVSTDGYFEFRATTQNGYRLAGLSNGDTNQGSAEIDFAIYPYYGTALYIHESGVSRGQFGTYAAGDLLRVGVENGVVVYRKNGALLYTSAVAPRYPLLVDTSLYSMGAAINEAVIAGTLQEVGVSAPWFSVAAGDYATAQSVVVTGTPAAVIHYTTNGVDPTESDPVLASGGTVLVDQSLTLKARAFAAGLFPSATTTARYTIGLTATAEPVVWTNLVNVSASGNTITKTEGPSNAFNAGAASTKGIVSTDGYFEFRATTQNGYRLAGLSNGDTNQGSAEIDFAIYPYYGTALYIHESGVSRGQFGTYAAGDLLRVGVENGVVVYRKNGALLYTSAVAPRYPLLVDTSLYSMGAAINEAVIAGTLQEVGVSAPWFSVAAGDYATAQSVVVTGTPAAVIHYTTNGVDPTESDPVLASGGTVLVDQSLTLKARAFAAGLFPSATTTARYTIGLTATAEPVVWTNLVNVSASGNTITKTEGPSNAFNAGAASTKGIVSTDGYFEFRATTQNGYRLAGLSNGDTNQGSAEIDFAIYPYYGTALYIHESGVSRGQFGTYAAGDLLRVGVENGVVVYRKNGALLYTSAVAPRYPLLVDTSLYSMGTAINEAVIAGTLQEVGVSAPWFSVAAGDYATAQGVVVTGTPAAVIHYTTNGVDPTESDPVLASGGTVLVDQSLTLKARAFAAGLFPSATTTARYTIGLTATAEPVVWTNLVNVSASGNTITKTEGPSNAFNAGAASTKGIVSTDGYFEFRATTQNGYRLAGLSNGDTNQGSAEIDFAIYPYYGTALYIHESGVSRGQFGTYAAGDLLRVGVENGVVVYRKNGALLYTSAVAPRYPLLVDTSLYSMGAAINEAVIAGTLQEVGVSAPWFSVAAGDYATAQSVVVTGTPAAVIHYTTNGVDPTESDPVLASGGTVLVDQSLTLKARAFAAGLFPSATTTARYTIGLTATAEPVVWTNLVNVSASGNTITKTEGPSNAFNAGAASTKGIVSTDGYLEFRATTQNGYRLAGLSNGDTNQGSAEIDFAIYPYYGTALYIHESGVSRGQFGTYAAGDLLRVGVENGVVVYRKNGALLYTSAVAPSYPLLVDTSLYSMGTAINEAVIAGTLQDIRVAAPVLNPGSGTYSVAPNVTLSTSPAGAVIRYTTDGTEPTSSSSVYSSPIAVTTTPLTLKAKAFLTNYLDSNTASDTYTLKVGTPTIAPGGGTYPAAQSVTLSCVTPDATIRFTTDGSEPTQASAIYYNPIALGTATTLKTKAYLAGWSDSDTATAVYAFNYGTLATPTINPAAGTYSAPQPVTLSAEAGATIRYTTDGSEPAETSPAYSGAFTVDTPSTVKAKAFRVDWTPSATASSTYAFKAATPSLAPPGGTYATAQTVTPTTTSPGAEIRYTTDGNEPTASSALYSTPISVSATTTLKAKAFRSGWQDSDTAEAAYSIGAGGAIGAGTYHSLAANSAGLVRGWGANFSGQVGDGTTAPRFVPTEIAGLTDVRAVGGGEAFTVVLKDDGTVWAWGSGASGQLGLGDFDPRLTPQQVPGITNASALAVGGAHVLVLLADGSVLTWGSNAWSQLGNGAGPDQPSPQPVSELTGITAVAAGSRHSLALSDTGVVWSWGGGLFGALGNGSEAEQPTPVPIANFDGVLTIASGSSAFHSFAVKSDGTVWGWGANHVNQVESSSAAVLLTPTPVAGISSPSRISAGGGHSLAVTADGSLWAWGSNTYGQTGLVTSAVPVLISGVGLVADVSAGGYHSLVLERDGTIVAFGSNAYGQVGDGTNEHRPELTIVAGPGFAWKVGLPVFSAPAGTYSADLEVSIQSATPGSVVHYTTTGADPTEADPVAVAPVHLTAPQAAVLKAKAWAPGYLPSSVAIAAYDFRVGTPYADPAGDVYDTPQVVALATETPGAEIRYTADGTEPSTSSSLYEAPIAISTSATLKAKAYLSGWMDSATMEELYEIPVIVGSISAGPTHLLYAAADGRVLAWGENERGQLGTGMTNPAQEPTETGLLGVSAVAAGGLHSLALKVAGTVWAWGSNAAGQLGLPSGADQLTPAAVGGLPIIRAIAAGSAHSLALDDDGNVWSWGANASGQLGNGSTTDSATPTQVINLGFVVAFAAGDEHSLALTSDGQVWAWGRNDAGQLGNYSFEPSSTPQPVAGPVGVTRVAAGSHHSLAIDADGALWGWGQGSSRQLGGGATEPLNHAAILGRNDECFPSGEGEDEGEGEESCTFRPFEGVQLEEGGLHHSLGIVTLPSGPSLVSWGSETPPPGAATILSDIPIADVVRLSSAGDNNLALTQAGEVFYWRQPANGRADPVLVIAPGGSVPASVPSFDLAPGTYRTEVDVTVSSISPDATIRYTTDGTEPGPGSIEVASGGVVHTERSTTLRAVALAPGRPSSAERSATYTLKVLDPVLDPPPSGLDGTTEISVSVATPGAELSYSIDGGDPEPIQNGIIPVTPPADLVVTASRGGWESSSVSVSYYLGVRTPVITPPGGHFSEPVTVTITSATPGATLRYTMDGTTPQFFHPAIASGGTLVVDRALTLTVKAWRDDIAESQVASAAFTYALPKPVLISKRTAAADSPLYVYGSSGVTWATVRCTTDGSEPNTISPPCGRGIPIDVSTTVKAKAFLMGWTPSETATETFTVASGAVPVPTLSLPSGRYPSRRHVSVTSTASGAVVRYTTNGADPTTSDALVPGDGRVLIDHSLVLKVRAFVSARASLVATGEYFITGAVASEGSVVVLKTDGTVWAWGNNTYGQIGDPATTVDEVLQPVQSQIDSVIELASSAFHSVALKADRTVWTWGSDFAGELGTTGTPSGTPTAVGVGDVVGVAAGGGYSAALKSDGSLWTWGQGQAPAPVPNLQCVRILTSFDRLVCIDSSGAALRGNVGGPFSVWESGRGTLGPAVDGDGGNTGFFLTDNLSNTQEPKIARPWSVSAASASTALARGGSAWIVFPGYTETRDRLFVEAGSVVSIGHRTIVSATGEVWRWGRDWGDGTPPPPSVDIDVEPRVVPGFDLLDDLWLSQDSDGDGLTNAQELDFGTDPYGADTNEDGVPDGVSVGINRDPISLDLDGDGLSNAAEIAAGTDPLNPDSDGDGHRDGEDLFPLDPDRWQVDPPNPADSTPPTIILKQPLGAVLITTVP